MSVFVDTSALIAYLDADDPRNPAAVGAFRDLVEREALVTHNYVVAESAAVVHRRMGPVATRLLLEDVVPVLEVVWVDADLHGAAVGAFLAALRRRTSLVDWVSFEAMRRLGIRRAFAFDRDFEAQGFGTIP